MIELIDVLNENGVKTGEVATRDEVHEKGLWHRSIVVAILDKNNRILLQKRSANKEKNAGMWDISAAGHLSAGQDSVSAAAREINEEVSINLDYRIEVKDFRFMYSFRREEVFGGGAFIERQFYDFFVLRQEGLDLGKIQFQTSEVQDIKLCTMSELRAMIEKKQIVDRPEVYGELESYLYRM